MYITYMTRGMKFDRLLLNTAVLSKPIGVLGGSPYLKTVVLKVDRTSFRESYMDMDPRKSGILEER